MLRKPPPQTDQDHSESDELFLEMFKDQFTFFFALTVAVMEFLKKLKKKDKKAS
jgi:hypothetical protein